MIVVSLDVDFYETRTRNNPGPSAPDIREGGMAIGPGKVTELGLPGLHVTVNPPASSQVRHLHHGQFRDLGYPIAA